MTDCCIFPSFQGYNLYILGLTCLFLCAKYDDYTYLQYQGFILLCKKELLCAKRHLEATIVQSESFELLHYELYILNNLDWNIYLPSSIRYFERFFRAVKSLLPVSPN